MPSVWPGHLDVAAPACRPEASHGRVVAEADGSFRSAYQRDRDRIVHSTAFRRLEHKTQVIVDLSGDHFRTRLTHSLEVAQIARTIARVFGLDEDLAEAVALAHDLGHSPFGHAGETALAQALAPWGGFDHNIQTFRVLTALEQRYVGFDGLNLTAETLEGVVKHNGPLTAPWPAVIARHPLAELMRLAEQPPLEAQIAALADDIAYINHDLDDGIRARFFTLDELTELPVVGGIVTLTTGRFPGVRDERLVHETIRRLIDRMVSDLVEESAARLSKARPRHLEEVRGASSPLIAFSPEMEEAVARIRKFLHQNMYAHHEIARMARKAGGIVRNLVAVFVEAPHLMPPRWRARAGDAAEEATAHAVRDYIAGMTDRFAVDEHASLFGTQQERRARL